MKLTKKYHLKPNVTIEDIMAEAKVKAMRHGEGGSWINKRDVYFISCPCGDEEITLNIGFPEDLSLWDDYDDVLLLDEMGCQPYYPFYKAIEEINTRNPYVMNIVGHYDKIMNSFRFLEGKKGDAS